MSTNYQIPSNMLVYQQSYSPADLVRLGTYDNVLSVQDPLISNALWRSTAYAGHTLGGNADVANRIKGSYTNMAGDYSALMDSYHANWTDILGEVDKSHEELFTRNYK